MLLKLDVTDQEFFRIIRLKNLNAENFKDHFYDEEAPKKKEESKGEIAEI